MKVTMKATSFFDNAIQLRHTECEPLSHSYGTEDTSYNPSKLSNPRTPTWRTRFSSWRGGVAACIGIVSLVLLLNIGLAILTATIWDTKDGISTAYRGDCAVASRTTTVIHLVINLFSSLLLGASNYCMQRLVAPTRKEIDDAHAKRKWLDIGIPSVRNLTLINKTRVFLWLLLGLSSVPLHFVYNSVVFETIAPNEVTFAAVAPEFLTNKTSWSYGNTGSRPGDTSGDSWNSTQFPIFNSTFDNYITRLQNKLLDGRYLDRTIFHNLTSDECVSRYHAAFVTSGNGYGIMNKTTEPGVPYLNAASGSGELVSNNYSPLFKSLQIVPSRCEVQFSQIILWVVIACNISKVMIMALILWRFNVEAIIIIGDAIQSFLRHPDITTEDCCLMSLRNVAKIWKELLLRNSQYYPTLGWQPWGASCSRRRWGTSLFLYAAALATTGALFFVMQTNKVGEKKNGFGQVDTESSAFLVDINLPFNNSIIPHVLLANLPQAVVSFIYLTYNAIFTCMLANREWCQYGVKRAPLRVTFPRSGQRSTYFLQLPYTFSVPLLIGGVLLHWFISQTIFLIRFAMYKDGILTELSGRLGQYRHMTKGSKGVFTGIGYSDSAFIASLTWGSIIVVIIIVVSSVMTYPWRSVPLGGTNSAVISAACHTKHKKGGIHELQEDDIACQPLRWGVTIRGGKDKIGHCCLTNKGVGRPVEGYLYAGDIN